MSRKRLLQAGAGLATMSVLGPIGCGAPAASRTGTGRTIARTKPKVSSLPFERAFVFLDSMMDTYASGSSLRLARSFVPTPALDLGDTAFLYDNALIIIALLKRGQSADLARARILGDSLLYAQQHGSQQDGRLHDGYHTNPFIRSDGSANETKSGSATGNMAWAGLSLVHLYLRTRKTRYLDGARALGMWIQANTRDTRGAGGYTGGVDPNGLSLQWKSTEHNVDSYSLFRLLGSITGSRAWHGRAKYALALVRAMWAPAAQHFWTGTESDGITINQNPIPEDVQTWTNLATLNTAYVPTLAWAEQNLAASPGNFYGVSFSTADLNGVWLEGTGHLAAALEVTGNRTAARRYLRAIEYAQKNASHADGLGIVAASRDGLQTGFGDQYFCALHTGATAWYCIAKLGANPFRA
jgi:hypothetical protein